MFRKQLVRHSVAASACPDLGVRVRIVMILSEPVLSLITLFGCKSFNSAHAIKNCTKPEFL